MFSENQIEEIRTIVQSYVQDHDRDDTRHTFMRESLHGMHTALVVDTADPLKMGGIRWYNPNFVDRNVHKDGLPWAYPISPFGGFDDSGCTWVPPAGARVAIMFQNGDRNAAYYIGSIWDRHRGPDNNHLDFWNYPNSEYETLWSGKRNGYLVGDNTGDQVFPPWNTENYNGYDIDSVTDFYHDPQQFYGTTNPHIKGFKTEGKHYAKYVDGDPQCNRRWSRAEYGTGCGNVFMMKDDHLHPAGQWAFSGTQADLSDPVHFCQNTESSCCAGEQQPCPPRPCPHRGVSNSSIDRTRRFANPFYKRSEEMRIYNGANTPQANRCELDQSGMFWQTLSGHQMAFDDSVNQPTGVPSWDRDFDFGCDDTFRGRMYMRSATGHVFGLNDMEDVGFSRVRGQDNGIGMTTASGNFFELNDHTLPDTACSQRRAGDRRGVTIGTTSTHLFRMSDHRLEQASEVRKDGGIPKKHDRDGFEGYCLLRSGYGLQLLMKDADRQDRTANQFIQLLAPQVTNVERGPHMLVMQEQAEGPGLVMLRAGGVYYQGSNDETIEVVGTDGNPSSKFMTVTDNYLVDVKNLYFNHNEITMFFSESYIFLLAGRDCPPPDDTDEMREGSTANQEQDIANAQQNPGTTSGKSEGGPCVYNVITSKDPWVCPATGYVHYGIMANADGVLLDSRSKRVFASADKVEQ